MNVTTATFSYGSAVVAYTILSIALLSVWKERLSSFPFLLALIATVIWAAVQVTFTDPKSGSDILLVTLDIAVTGTWLFFLTSLFRGALTTGRFWLAPFASNTLSLVLLLTGTVLAVVPNRQIAAGYVEMLRIGLLAITLYGLVAIEHIYRNARWVQRRGLKFLLLGIGLILAFNLFWYTSTLITGTLNSVAWDARGFVAALAAVLIGISGSRKREWSPGLFVSRKVILYITTFIAAGVYLLAVMIAGYYIRNIDPAWGSSAQLIFITAAAAALLLIFLSDRARSRTRVFVAKHFFENKYDYRDEWLRLIDTMSDAGDGLPLEKRAIKALANILDVHSGVLWHRNADGSEFCAKSGWGVRYSRECISANHSLVQFMVKTRWIVDLREYRRDMSTHRGLDLEDLGDSLDSFDIVVPLMQDLEMVGFVALGQPQSLAALNFEDHDLLKIAGQQIARDLAQAEASDKLSQTLQFEAFNRLTAYIMHDLKNAIAQQSLVVENARKHRRNPEFIDDAMDTIGRSVIRMKRVISHLQQGDIQFQPQVIDVGEALKNAVDASRDRRPIPRLTSNANGATVKLDPDRFFMAICHAIRNAQDSTPAEGDIQISYEVDGQSCKISIIDNGEGMEQEFVQNRLFRPFDSTKGRRGNGNWRLSDQRNRACGKWHG